MKSLDQQKRTSTVEGFRGYKNSETGLLTSINWDRLARSIPKVHKKLMNDFLTFGRAKYSDENGKVKRKSPF